MKNVSLFILALIVANNAIAQEVSLKHSIIYAGNKPIAQLKNYKANPFHCTVATTDGKELISIHHSRLYVKNQPAYCVTFLDDKKKALLVCKGKSPIQYIIREMVKYNLINSGPDTDGQAEAQYIQSHPLPAGYIDVDDAIEY